MANKQPFYHRVDGVMFTLTQEIDEDDFKKLLEIALKALQTKKGGPSIYVEGSLEIEEWGGAEPGDPADLM